MRTILQSVFTIALLSLGLTVSAQTRYLNDVFSAVTITADVTYATNISIFPMLQGLAPGPQDIKCDIYEPTGDSLTNRPVIILLHTGSYLPPLLNGKPTGSKSDSSIVEQCTRWAKKGYVAVAMNYRLGWNPTSTDQNVRTSTLLQAAYRGIQDAKAMVRYMRMTEDNGNPYGIDESKIVLGGQGTGGYISLGYATLNDESELYLNKFLDFTDPSNPTPYVYPPFFGNIDGTDSAWLPAAASATGQIELWNIPNNPSYSNDINMAFNIGGCLADSSWLEAGVVPMVSFHCAKDENGPYANGDVIVPSTGDFVVEAQGSYIVQKHQDMYGNNAAFSGAGFTDPITQQAAINNTFYSTINNYNVGNNYEGLYTFVTPAPSTTPNPYGQAYTESGSPWDWWDNALFEAQSQAVNGPAPAGYFAANSILGNPNMSANKGNLYLDTIQGYLNPRMYEVLNLNSSATPTWDCNGQGACYDPGNGTGQYTSLISCQSNCSSSGYSIPFSEDFANEIPFTWSEGYSNTSASAPWIYRGPSTSPGVNIGSQGAYAGTNGPIVSPTASNGFMIFDSDYYDNGGTAGNFGAGPYPSTNGHFGTLTTPSIDCSNYSNNDLTLKFNSFYREFTGIAKIAFSVDGGITFTDTMEVHPNIGVNKKTDNDEVVMIILPSNIVGNYDVRIQFIYDGTVLYNTWYGYYFWMIDDIVLMETPPYFLEIENVNYAGMSTSNGLGVNYTIKPLNQSNNNPYQFEGELINNGAQNLQNAQLNVMVNKIGTGQVFSDNSTNITLNTGSTYLASTNNTYFPNNTGSYEINFFGSSDSINSTDTTMLMAYISDTVYARDDNTVGGNWELGRSCGGLVLGNRFEIFDTDILTSVSAHISDYSVPGSNMYAVLYEIDTMSNSFAFVDQSSDYTITTADTNNWVTIGLDNNTLDAGNQYLIAIGGYAHPIDTFGINTSVNALPNTSHIQDNGCNIGNGGGFGDWYYISKTPMIRANFGNNNTNISGCTDSLAFNYDPTATADDGSCIYCNISNTFMYTAPSTSTSCDGFILSSASSSSPITNYNWVNSQGSFMGSSNFISNLCNDAYILTLTDSAGCTFVDTLILGTIFGCTDSLATNYNPFASVDDGSCLYPTVYGCTDSLAYNYYVGANTDDGSCQYCDLSVNLFVNQNSTPTACDGFIVITTAPTSNGPVIYLWSTGSTQNNIVGLCSGTYTLTVTDAVGCTIDTTLTIGQIPVYGCTGPSYCNYDPLATMDDGSCTGMFGCMDHLYVEFSAAATCDDGSCVTLVTNICGASPITGLGVSNVIHDRASLNFDNMNTYDASGAQICRVDQLRIRYREVGTSSWSQKNMAAPTGYDPTTGVCNSTQNTNKLVLGLSGSTTYEWEMRVWYCATGSTAWVDGPDFTTLGECPEVGNLTVTTPTTTKATFTWDDSNGAYSFVRIKMRVDSITNPQGSDWFNVGGAGVSYPTFTKNKSGLVSGETYRGQARTWCDPNGGAYKSLSWTSLVTWTQPTSVRLEGGSSIANLTIFPNPSRDVFNVSFTSEYAQDLKVRILNIIGEELINEDLQQFIGQYTKQINLSNNAKGIYFLEIETNDGVINKKLILQ